MISITGEPVRIYLAKRFAVLSAARGGAIFPKAVSARTHRRLSVQSALRIFFPSLPLYNVYILLHFLVLVNELTSIFYSIFKENPVIFNKSSLYWLFYPHRSNVRGF